MIIGAVVSWGPIEETSDEPVVEIADPGHRAS